MPALPPKVLKHIYGMASNLLIAIYFMPYSISGHSIDAAVRNPNDMRRLLHGIAQRIAIYDDQLGIFDGFLDDPSDIPASKPAPPAAGFQVNGIDGKFEIQITLPQDAQLQT